LRDRGQHARTIALPGPLCSRGECLDGNSWLWEFAIEIARDALRDHDGAIERHREESRQRAMALTAATPRCPSCQTVFVECQRRPAMYLGHWCSEVKWLIAATVAEVLAC